MKLIDEFIEYAESIGLTVKVYHCDDSDSFDKIFGDDNDLQSNKYSELCVEELHDDYSSTQLTNFTMYQKHWMKSYNRYFTNIIPKELIKEYFEE